VYAERASASRRTPFSLLRIPKSQLFDFDPFEPFDRSFVDLDLVAIPDPFHLAVAQIDDTARGAEHLVIVRDRDDGHTVLRAQAETQFDDLLPRPHEGLAGLGKWLVQ
jgi:hypothetical protein